MKIEQLFKQKEQISLESYLSKMGIENIQEYLFPTGLGLEDPFTYINMDKAVEMFKIHYEKLSKVYILCDSGDGDGYSSTISLISYMHLLNPNWDIEILIHPDKTRGFQDPTIMDKIRKEPRPFIIVPDSGTNDIKQVKELTQYYNIDILILDHHSLSTPIEDGILINNQVGEVDSCGSGGVVTHIFMRALDLTLGVNYSGKFIDLISLSILSDGMDVKSLQNRTYLYYGIFNRNNIINPLLKQFFEDYIGDKNYNQKNILFSVVPKVNSVGRSKEYELKEQMVRGFLGIEDVTEVSKVCGNCHKEQIESVASFIENNIDKIDRNNNVILFATKDVERTYSGLLAGKIKDKFNNKPTIIGKIKDGLMIGSVRSDVPLREILDKREYTTFAQGHNMQFGIGIKEDDIPKVIDYLNSIDIPEPSPIVVIKSLSSKSIKPEYFKIFEGYEELWNDNSLPKPIFHIKNISINTKNIKIMGKNKRTIKFNITGIDYIIFNSVKEDKENLLLGYYEKDKFVEDNQNKKINLEVLGYLSTNEWNGKVTNQIIINKFEVVSNKQPSIDDFF